jgi:phosphoglycerate dehydrogenase-like enzyme
MAFTFVMLPPQSDLYRGWARRLTATLPELNVIVAEDEAEAERAIVEADGAFGSISPALLSKARRLRWLQAPAAAPPAGYYFPELIEHPVTVTNMREIYNDHISAHVVAYVLAFARGLTHYMPLQVRREWKPLPLDTGVIHLPESTMVIVGLGGIGTEVARLARAFGMIVLATDARRTSPPPGVDELHGPDQLDSLLPRADFVVLTVPHTPETEGLMDRSRFQRMKSGAFFINIGRGKTTRLADLVASLQAGELAGAGLDVFEEEPLPPEHPLWILPNVLITPHVAGYGPYLDERRFEIVLDNCRGMINGTILRNVVDKRSWF